MLSRKIKNRIEEWGKMVVMVGAVILSLFFLWKENKACSEVGGTLVRTSFWVACVDELK